MGLTVVPVEFNRRAGDPPVETWAFPDTQIKGEDKSTGELYRVDPHDASADRPPAGVELSQKYQQVGTGSTLHARAGDGVADLYAIGKLISEWGKEPVRVCHEQMIAHCRKRYDAERTSQDGQPRTEASDELMFWPFAGYNAPPPRLFELILGISPFLQSYYTREMGAHFIGTFIETNGIGSEQWAGIVDHEPRLVDGDTSHIEARLCFHEDREKRWSTRVSSRGEDAFVFVVDKADTLEYVNVPRSLYPRMISKRLMLTLPRMTLEMAMRSGSRQEEWLMDTPSYKATVAAAPMAAAAGMIRVDSEYAPRVLDVFRIWNTEGSPNKPPDGGGRWYQIGNPRDLCWHTPIELTLENAERGSRILKASLGADHGEITFDLRYDRVRMRLVEARDPSNLEGPTPVEDWFDHERIKMYADQTYYDNQVGCHGIRRGSAADYALDTKVYERDEYVDLEERYQAPQWFALEFKAGTGQEHVNAYGLRRTPGCRWVHTIEASIRRGMFRAEEVAARFDAEMGYMRTHLKKGTDPNTIRDAWGTARMQHVSEPTEEKVRSTQHHHTRQPAASTTPAPAFPLPHLIRFHPYRPMEQAMTLATVNDTLCQDRMSDGSESGLVSRDVRGGVVADIAQHAARGRQLPG